MIIDLRLFANLRGFAPKTGPSNAFELPEGSSVADVIRTLGIPPDKPKILLVNGRHADPGHVLHDGDVLSLFPPVAGG